MKNIKFRGKSYNNCSKIFKFHELEMGYCYLANNIIDYGSTHNLPLKYYISEKKNLFEVMLKSGSFWKYEMYVHSHIDIPYFNTISIDLSLDPMVNCYKIEEVQNDINVGRENPSKRKCKFPFEKLYDSNHPYSFSNCMAVLRKNLEMKYCNCTLSYSPPKCEYSFIQ
ncbi:uncharacterized protein LOC119684880 [Teleopsis dalmanni]|uniref:uncharacterized protein LOC119684880 n=1 Tax=Teleopsis dalmanni TaxID=139649 RepID=UPI0018CD63F8|nr:uncharacterized protein LOC119684880 [Teleopsis dalmanni]